MQLTQLTATPAQCMSLLELGINAPSFLHHVGMDKNFSRYETKAVDLTDHCGYIPISPAWTKAELDVMIGPEFSKPDLMKPEMVIKEDDETTYPVYYMEKMMGFKNGAQASADALIYLLQKKAVRANDANARYTAVFIKDVNNEG